MEHAIISNTEKHLATINLKREEKMNRTSGQ